MATNTSQASSQSPTESAGSTEPSESADSAAPTGSRQAAHARGPWALIDARQTDERGASTPRYVCPTTQLSGLSLIARHARVAARQGIVGATIVVTDSDEQARIVAALAAKPPPAAFAIEFADAPPDDNARAVVQLEACAVYAGAAVAAAAVEASAHNSATPKPLVRIRERADLREARRALAELIRKSVDQDGIVSYYAFRPLSGLMTKALLNTPITPNQVSLISMGFGISAAICAGFGGFPMVAIAGLLYWVGAVVDCVDGELARLRVQGSKLGEWLDTLADDVSTYGLLAGLGIGLARQGGDMWWQYAGIGGAVIGFLLQAKLYADLHAWKMPIDTAQYPWFFGTPSEGDHASRGFVGKLVYVIGFVFRRDAFVTIVAIALGFGFARAAVMGLSVGLIFFLVMFVVHAIVMIRRGESSAVNHR